MTNAKYIFYHTFGCKLNFAETSSLQFQMEKMGYNTVHTLNKQTTPDIIVINSCSVTEVADKKCRQYIRSINRRFPESDIVVTGCYAQLKPHEVSALQGVKLVVGTDMKGQLPQIISSMSGDTHQSFITPTTDIENFTPSCARGDRTRFFLKVQDGCDYRCSYCTIPKARGKSRSPHIDLLVSQAEDAAREGAKEIVLTGVNIGDFGKGTDKNLLHLIQALDKIEDIERYRISSIEPNLLTEDILKFCSQSRAFMPHFHIPLQSGSDKVLALMRRRYNTAFFANRIEMVRHYIPDAFIGVDLIVGARGETPEFFENSKNFVQSLDISRLHVFTYSERPGTDALKIDYKVSPTQQAERVKQMLDISDRKLELFSKRFLGTVRPVLLERKNSDGNMTGYTDNYLKVKVKTEPSVNLENKIIPLFLDSFDSAGQSINAKCEITD